LTKGGTTGIKSGKFIHGQTPDEKKIQNEKRRMTK